jgi:hypothetical protein
MFGVEPAGAASMTAALKEGRSVALEKIDPFVDGAAVRKVGELTYKVCSETLDHIHTVPEELKLFLMGCLGGVWFWKKEFLEIDSAFFESHCNGNEKKYALLHKYLSRP